MTVAKPPRSLTHLAVGFQGLDRTRDPCNKASASNGNHDDINFWDILDNLHTKHTISSSENFFSENEFLSSERPALTSIPIVPAPAMIGGSSYPFT
jgi:hypothetical protein